MERTSAEKREFFEMQQAKQKKTTKNNPVINKGSIAYMEKDNVKKFNSAMEKRLMNSSGVGRPYAFQSVEKLKSDMSEYFDLCKKYDIIPTNVTLALWLDVDEDTLTNHANNPNSPFFGIMKNTKRYLHSIMQNGTLAGDINPVAYIFLAKNYYGMKDDKNIQVSATTNQAPVNNQETMDAIKKQIEEENIPDAVINEK